MCYGIRISSTIHLNTLTIPIQNKKCLKTAKTASEDNNFPLPFEVQPRLCCLYKCIHRQPKPNLCLPALLSKLSAKSTFSSHIMVFLGMRGDGTLFGYSQIQGSLNSQMYHTLLQNRVLPDVRQGNGGTLAGLMPDA